MFIVDVKNRIVMPVPYTDSNEAEMHTDFLNRMCGTNNYQVWQSWYEKEAEEKAEEAKIARAMAEVWEKEAKLLKEAGL